MSYRIFEQTDPISPLTLDRVSCGVPLTSTCPIFQLPVELLSSITPYLSGADLASLALVDRDCRQLARSIQFATVKMDYYRRTTPSLLGKLEIEIGERFQCQSTIGACVRRLIVTEMPNPVSGETVRDLAQQSRDANHQSQKNIYISTLCAVIAGALPNLLTLDWNVPVTLSPQFLQSLAAPPMKYLKLCDVSLSQVYPRGAPPVVEHEDRKWALETLDVTVVGKFLDSDSALLHIVHHASPTLRALAWRSSIISWKMSSFFRDRMPFFPSLRVLLLDRVGVEGDALAVLLWHTTQVRSLFVDSTGAGISRNLRLSGNVHTLERFHWSKHRVDNYDDVLAFLNANPQVRVFETASPLPTSFVCERLLPKLRRFQDLTILFLIWEGKNIPGDALRLLGLMTTLRHVWLSAGSQTSYRHDWEIDHGAIHRSLAPLHHLKSLAFSQDTYRVWWNGESSERYYTVKRVPMPHYYECLSMDEVDEIEMRNDFLGSSHQELDEDEIQGLLQSVQDLEDLGWERYHQRCMVELGTSYAERFPALEWCYMGQLSMVIRDHHHSRKAGLEITERDISWKVLKKEWEVRTAIY